MIIPARYSSRQPPEKQQSRDHKMAGIFHLVFTKKKKNLFHVPVLHERTVCKFLNDSMAGELPASFPKRLPNKEMLRFFSMEPNGHGKGYSMS